MSEPMLIQATELNTLLDERRGKQILVCDCSFDLARSEAGRQAYEAGHIPGAVYVHLEDDLSAPRSGRNGRHPLPAANVFANRMAELGADNDTLIIAYDNANSMYAARLWWMLGWMGHQRRQVLDGGITAWKNAGLPIEKGQALPVSRGDFTQRSSLHGSVDYKAVRANLQSSERQLIDARNADRFRGQNETIDPKAGHIPGARNRFFMGNLDAQGRFKPPAQLREEFTTLLAGRDPSSIIHQCGSGVTACHNLLAMEIAGLPGSSLYPGSWSEWSQQDDTPVATTED
jgi:thiosulfate/3-mercaptopyruvate sulfurtransferase